MNKQALFSSCPLATKNLKNEGHIFHEAAEIFVDLTLKILPTGRENELKAKIDSKHRFQGKDGSPSILSKLT